MTAIHYTSFPQFCKGASEVCNVETSIKTIKFSKEYPSRPVQGTYAGLSISLEWLKLHPSDVIHQSLCQFFKKYLNTFEISDFYCNAGRPY